MNAINRAVTSFFDLVLTPLEAVGDEFAILVVSGVFGVLALWIFKHISWQKGIKGTKDRIKGHLIEIRIYQDDLVTVGKAIGQLSEAEAASAAAAEGEEAGPEEAGRTPDGPPPLRSFEEWLDELGGAAG